MYKRDRINGERAWHLSSGCVSPGPGACVSQGLGVWDWSWIIWIQSPAPALTWIPLTAAQWTLSLWPVTRSGGIIYETNSASQNSPGQRWSGHYISFTFQPHSFYFFYSAGRGGQRGDTRPIMEFLSSWLNPQLCSHFKPLPSFDRCHQEEPLMKLKQTRRGCCLTPPCV